MTTWIFPANPDDFQIKDAFQELKIIDWGTNNKVKTGDLVYVYRSIGKDNVEGKIILKTEVIKENVARSEFINDRKFWLGRNFDLNNSKKYIRVKLVDGIFNDEISDKFSYSNLKKNGLRAKMMGPIILDNNPKLKEYIENTLKDN